MKPASSPIPCDWLPELTEGYLRAYTRVTPERSDGLWGYRLESRDAYRGAGFLVGFVTGRTRGTAALAAKTLELPACVVCAYVRPASSPLHRKLVRRPESPFRFAFQRLTKYTARRPRFELREKAWSALSRCQPLSAFPPGEEEKYARNYFTETLVLVVRSGLPRDLLRD